MSDQEVYRAIEAFTRTAEPVDARPREGFVIDFKEEWGDRGLHSVAAFSHTFGGLLFVGVSEVDARPDKLIGIECSCELKTRIASSIATNISPTPSFQIAECGVPGNPNRKLAVVRVRQGSQIFYLTKKGEQPVYVRNEDESRPADAARLRSLIERKVQPIQTDAERRLEAVRNSLNLTRTHPSNNNPVRISFVPIGYPLLVLDSSVELQFRKLLRNLTVLIYGHDQSQCEQEETRDVNSYQWRWFFHSLAHETVWRLTSAGDIGMATQSQVKSEVANSWSPGNVVAELWYMMPIAREFWIQSGSFFGDARVDITLTAAGIGMITASTMFLWRQTVEGLDKFGNFNSDLGQSITSKPSTPSPPQVSAGGVFSTSLPRDSVADLIASLANQLLRGFGY